MTEFSREYTPAQKAYKNSTFLNGGGSRHIRILCEYEEPHERLKEHGIQATILFFGSARGKSREQFDAIKTKLETDIAAAKASGDSSEKFEKELERLNAGAWMVEYYDKIVELSRRLTAWSCNSGIKLAKGRTLSGVNRASHPHVSTAAAVKQPQSAVVITGGGPGFMEAANKGASLVDGAVNIGMGISLPFESGLNRYVTPDLAFIFHYFFTRKFWMVYNTQALVCCPGGVGTCDELFEFLTLKQTGKLPGDLPVVLFGKQFWSTIINWEALAGYGVVAKKDVEDLFITDDIDAAFTFVTERLSQNPIFNTVDMTKFTA